METFEKDCLSLQDEKKNGFVTAVKPHQVLQIANSVLSFYGFEAASIKEGLKVLSGMTKAIQTNSLNDKVFGVLEAEFQDRMTQIQVSDSFDNHTIFSAWNYLAGIIWVASFCGQPILKKSEYYRKWAGCSPWSEKQGCRNDF